MDEDIKGKLKKDIKNLGEGKETSDITGMSEFITFYKAASNYKQREKDGLEPLKPYLKEIEEIKDLNDLASKSASLTDKGSLFHLVTTLELTQRIPVKNKFN